MIGAVVVLVALVRMAAPFRTAALGMVNVALGAWLIVAPFVLAYSITTATWTGGIVMVLA